MPHSFLSLERVLDTLDATQEDKKGHRGHNTDGSALQQGVHPKGKASHPGAQQLCKKWLYGLGVGFETPALGELWVN